MSDTSLSDNLSWLFLQTSFKTKQSIIKIAETRELTVPQLYTLISMQPNTPLQMNEIATLLSCDPSNVTGIIDRMFAGNYIERQEKPHDRRAKLVTLTTRGVQLRADIMEKIAENEPPLFNNLSSAQKLELKK